MFELKTKPGPSHSKKFLLLILLFLYLTSASESKPSLTSFSGQTMTMEYRILVGGSLQASDVETIQATISKTFEEIDRIYNKWNPNSELSKLNRSPEKQQIPLSKELETFLLRTKKLFEITQKRFDPTVESAQKIWKPYLSQGKFPPQEEIQTASSLIGLENVEIANGTFLKKSNGITLDLGGIAKGYAIDCLIEKLHALGFSSLYVEWGGEIRTIGKHPEGRPWRVFIANVHDNNPKEDLAVFEMHDIAVASSGDYLQNWEVEGVRYFHIFNPKTGFPLISHDQTICSATITADDCMTADALATAAMTFSSLEEAESWLQEIKPLIPKLQYWIVTSCGLMIQEASTPLLIN